LTLLTEPPQEQLLNLSFCFLPQGLDVIQQAQSGTGKTATFCAGILNNLDYNLQECQGLVLAPTRELAQQIEKVMRALGDYLQVTDGWVAACKTRGSRVVRTPFPAWIVSMAAAPPSAQLAECFLSSSSGRLQWGSWQCVSTQ
jgi:hypothetical protein